MTEQYEFSHTPSSFENDLGGGAGRNAAAIRRARSLIERGSLNGIVAIV
jgi:hypothetical protein